MAAVAERVVAVAGSGGVVAVAGSDVVVAVAEAAVVVVFGWTTAAERPTAGDGGGGGGGGGTFDFPGVLPGTWRS